MSESVNTFRKWLLDQCKVEHEFFLAKISLEMAEWTIDDFCNTFKAYHGISNISYEVDFFDTGYNVIWSDNDNND